MATNEIKMDTRNAGAVFGALAALPTILGLYTANQNTPFRDHAGMYFLLILGITLVLYLIATISVKMGDSSSKEPGITAVVRGGMLGLNSVLNGMLIWLLATPLIDETPAVIVGLVVGFVNWLGCLSTITNSDIFQGVCGWLNWLMPMSWLIVGLGAIFMIISAILAIPGHLLGVDFLKFGGETTATSGKHIEVDWKTGTIFMFGGLVANLNYLKTAFNMGNFSFVHRKADNTHIEHEAGHTLNLAVFGAIFHLIGAIDENFPVIGGGHSCLL